MSTPYICAGTIVMNRRGQEGKVIVVDRKNKVATVRMDTAIRSEKLDDLKVVSYKGVM